MLPKQQHQKPTAQNQPGSFNSLDGEAEQPSFGPRDGEVSTGDIKSFVIINDIDVEEELFKVRKTEQNYFEVLSINFYQKTRSRSFDNNSDSRILKKMPSKFLNTSKLSKKTSFLTTTEGKSSLLSEYKTNITQEPKTEASKDIKPKLQTFTRRNTSPLRSPHPLPEKLNKPQTSPRTSPPRTRSPKDVRKDVPENNVNTKTTTVKKEPLFMIGNPSKPLAATKKEETRKVTSPNRKTSPNRRASSPKASPLKKMDSSKLPGIPEERIGENIEETVQVLQVSPSAIDMRPHEWDEAFQDRNVKQGSFSKGGEEIMNQSSMRESDKVTQDKSAITNSVGTSPAKVLTKEQQKEYTDYKDDEEIKELLSIENSLAIAISDLNSSRKVPNNTEGDVEESKAGSHTEEKAPNVFLADLLEMNGEQDKGKKGPKVEKIQIPKIKTVRTVVNKFARHQSPGTGKMSERSPNTINSNGSNRGVKVPATTREDLTRKVLKKEQTIETDVVKMKGKKLNFDPAPGVNGRRRNSAEKPANAEIVSPMKERKVEHGRQAKSPLLMKSERNWNNEEGAGKTKEKKERGQPNSPASVETKKALQFLDRLVSMKKREKV